MSDLFIEPITTTGIEQEIRLKYNLSLHAIRVNLLKYGTPTGNITIDIYQGDKDSGTIISTITKQMSELNDAVNNIYGYGMFNFELNSPLKKVGQYTIYTIVITSSTNIVDNYYAWIIDDVKDQSNLYGDNQTDGHAGSKTVKPYKLELIEYK